MPSGTREDEERICKICNNKLRPLYKNEDWEGRKYHVACFKGILKDIMNYHKICYKKIKSLFDFKKIEING